MVGHSSRAADAPRREDRNADRQTNTYLKILVRRRSKFCVSRRSRGLWRGDGVEVKTSSSLYWLLWRGITSLYTCSKLGTSRLLRAQGTAPRRGYDRSGATMMSIRKTSQHMAGCFAYIECIQRILPHSSSGRCGSGHGQLVPGLSGRNIAKNLPAWGNYDDSYLQCLHLLRPMTRDQDSNRQRG